MLQKYRRVGQVAAIAIGTAGLLASSFYYCCTPNSVHTSYLSTRRILRVMAAWRVRSNCTLTALAHSTYPDNGAPQRSMLA